jgi:hypothetical protein
MQQAWWFEHLNKLVKDVLTWPYIESIPSFVNRDIVRVRLEEKAASSDSAAFISDREFARFLLAAPTIYLALPLPLAQRALARRWAEPHYLQSFGLMPAGTVLVYTPKNREELGRLLFPFLWGLPFCLQVGQEKLDIETLV